MKPSKRALKMMERAKAAAREEVRKHLEAGFSVTGRRNGKPVVIKPKAG